MKRTLTLIATVMVLAPTAIALPSARNIMKAVYDRPDGDTRRAIVTITLVNRHNRKRVRTLVSYSRDYGKDTKSIMQFRKPADVRGIGFLAWEYNNPAKDDDRWLHLPALRRVRRISGPSKNDYFMGSDFTYDDMGDRVVDEGIHTLLHEETIDSHSYHVIQSVPRNTNDNYSRKISWVRKDAPVTCRVDYYDHHGKLLKQLRLTDVRKHQGFWTVYRMEMTNVQENHRTILERHEVSYDISAPESYFRVQMLERGKLR
jgi:hypothetical protein